MWQCVSIKVIVSLWVSLKLTLSLKINALLLFSEPGPGSPHLRTGRFQCSSDAAPVQSGSADGGQHLPPAPVPDRETLHNASDAVQQTPGYSPRPPPGAPQRASPSALLR